MCQWSDLTTIPEARRQGLLLSPTPRAAAPGAARVGWAPHQRPPPGSCSGAGDLAERSVGSAPASRSSARAPEEWAPSKYDIAPPKTGTTGRFEVCLKAGKWSRLCHTGSDGYHQERCECYGGRRRNAECFHLVTLFTRRFSMPCTQRSLPTTDHGSFPNLAQYRTASIPLECLSLERRD